jgi:MFS family permease
MNHSEQNRTSIGNAEALSNSGSVAIGTFVAVAIAHTMVDFMGMSVWPVYKTLAGLDVAKAGWIATVIAMSGTALQPLFGSIADRFGARRVILLGVLLTSFALLLGPLADHREALDRLLPTLFGLSGFYLIVFMILAAGRLGQDMFHPAGAGLAGSFSVRYGSTSLAVFIALGSIGFGLSQIIFGSVYNNFGHHTEILFIPMAILWAFVWLRCRPAEAQRKDRISLAASFGALRPVAKPILSLFLILGISSGVMSGLFFLMPEFVHEKGYPAWIGHGGAFGLIVLGATVFMVPIAQLADRIGRRRTMMAMMILSADQLSCHRAPDLAGTGVYRALHCGRSVFGDSESAGRCVRPKYRPAEKCKHRIGDPNGMGVVSWRHCAQHRGRTLSASGKQRYASFDVAWICQYRDGSAWLSATQN